MCNEQHTIMLRSTLRYITSHDCKCTPSGRNSEEVCALEIFFTVNETIYKFQGQKKRQMHYLTSW